MKKLNAIRSKAFDVIKSYPMVLTMALIAAISTVTFIELSEFNYQREKVYFDITKLIIVACLGISLMFAIKMISQRFGKRFWLEIAGTILLFRVYFLLPKKEEDFTEVYAYWLIPTFILSHLLVAFGAFLKRGIEINFWEYNKNLFVNIVLTAIFTGVLTGGVLLAISAVDHLFDLHIKGFRYGQTFFSLAIFGSSFIFLLFNEKGLFFLQRAGKYPVILKFFTQFVLIPLLLVYLLILYLYSIKILINWELPRGWVSYLVLAYSVVGILALLLVHPLKNITEKSWIKMFAKIFYWSLLPLLILLFVAIFTRILEYGYTEPRYFVLIIALWLTSVVLYFIFYKKSSIKFIPISLFIFGLFASVFPYFNAFSVAKRSQEKNFVQLLNDNNLLEAGKINFNKTINYALLSELTNKVDFLTDRKDHEFVAKFLTEEQKFNLDSLKGYSLKYEFKNLFKNVDYEQDQSPRENTYTVLNAKRWHLDISKYDDLLRTNGELKNTFDIDGKKLIINFEDLSNTGKPRFEISFDGEKIDLMKDFDQLFTNQPLDENTNVEELTISKTIAGYDFLFSFETISKNQYLQHELNYNIRRNDVIILIKKH